MYKIIKKMKISIITPSFNSAKTIEKTINSVISQKGIVLEYIIIDGGSKDDTLEIIEKYKDKITTIISESDSGLYNAMNKGIKLATGEIIGILNSDDYYSDDVLLSVHQAFEKSNAQACYGDIAYFNNNNYDKITRLWKAGEYNENKLNNGWIMPHPALFVKKDVYLKCGLFREDLNLAADYEFMLRMLKIHKIKVKYIPEIITMMRTGGASGKNLKSRMEGWKELKKSWQINNLKKPNCFIAKRLLSKISQYIVK